MRKGFTLVELLSVIVILAIILAITIPGISNVIESSRRGAAVSDAKMLLKTIEYKMLNNDTFDSTTITEKNIEEVLGIDANNYLRLTVKKMNGQFYITMVGKEKWDGITISGTKKSIRLDNTITTSNDSEERANVPALAEGMIPVKWYENGTEKYWVTTTEDDPNWYQYGNTKATRKWANVIQVTNESREAYLTPNKKVDIVNDVIAMWVWIPRYVYKTKPISEGDTTSGWHKSNAGIIDVQFTKGIDDNWNKGLVGPIDLREGAEASNALENGDRYTNHPAFTFGDTELTGIWVAKFEASSNNQEALYGGGDNPSLKVKSVPNVTSWRNITLNNIFTVTRAMETDNFYGWGNSGKGIDTHMMKNTEWGAAAYLSKSTYGKIDEIWINPSNTFIVGCAGGSVNDNNGSNGIGYDGCPNTYDTDNGNQASTTGNVYGIYDINGGTREATASYINNGHDNLTKGSNIINADSKYKNIYIIGPNNDNISNYDFTIALKGDAIYETSKTGEGTSSWHRDYSAIPVNDKPWYNRGGHYNDYGAYAGTFNFTSSSGLKYNYLSFRPVLLVGSGL